MPLLRLIPADTRIDFIGRRFFAYATSGVLILAAVLSLALHGLNLGVDFRGGILFEVNAQMPVDLAALRTTLGGLGLGEVTLQEFGTPGSLLIRVQRQDGGDAAQLRAMQAVKKTLGSGYDYRRVEVVGPTVSRELLVKGVVASILAVLGISVYVWFRFEWQFGVSALIATSHDVITTVGVYSIFDLEFNLSSIAALLTIAGYSINDTVVIFDRVRENLRRFKTMDLAALLNRSVNETLSRTLLTSGTTMLAVVALLVFGGPVIFGFSLAIAWGILVGTYSSIYVAAALLLYMTAIRATAEAGEDLRPPPRAD